jgi:hypothetical protein
MKPISFLRARQRLLSQRARILQTESKKFARLKGERSQVVYSLSYNKKEQQHATNDE